MKKSLFAAACVTLTSTLLGCGGGGGGGGSPSPAPSPGVSISGTVSAMSTSAVDSDTNDPMQQGRANNNTAPAPQSLGNPATVVGYVNVAGAGPDGPNRAAGDIWDLFRVTLTAGQVVELNFGDETVADLDLYIGDLQGNILATSNGVNRSECVRINTTGTYLVGVFAFAGASTYQASWGPVSLDTTCAVSTMSNSLEPAFVAGELLAKPKGGSAAETARRTLAEAQVDVVPAAHASLPHLLRLPADDVQRARALSTLARTSAGKRTASATQSDSAPTLEGLSAQGRRALDTANALKRLRASGQYEYVEYNPVMQAYQVGYGPWPPDDVDLPRMPHLDKIRLPETFNALNALNPKPAYVPIVAVIDTGIVGNHPDLANMQVAGYDFVSDITSAGDGNGIDPNPDDAATSPNSVFHGTHVAGTIAGQTFNKTGMVGVAPMARIMPLRVLGVNGRGSGNDILQAIAFAAGLTNNSGTVPTRRADVINMSLGGSGACPQPYREAIAAARAQGVIVVAAAGNEDGAPVGTPANCPGAIAVSAMSYSGQIATYSNVGPEVMVTAPGGDASRQAVNGPDLIWSASAAFIGNTRTPNFRGLQGTSMATPHVAGVMALMRAVNPNISPAQIDQLFTNGQLTDEIGAAGRDTLFGYGLINALKAITAAGGNTPPPESLPTLQLSTTRLDFGSATTTLPITLTRINNSTDTYASAQDSAGNENAVTVTPRAGNQPDGPYDLDVTVNRSLLATGEDLIQVELTSAQGRTLRFDVAVAPRGTPPTIGLAGVGPVYVLALNPSSLDTLAQANVTTNTRNYGYTIGGVTASSVVVVAGTDTDNDGFICGASEPCGAYPVLGAEPTVLNLSGNVTGIDFSLIGLSAASLSAPSARPATTRRGFARLQ
jgi:serine protease